MNNEEYLRQIVREAVEDVLYEFKSDIEYETKAKLLRDRNSGDHNHERRDRWKTTFPYSSTQDPASMMVDKKSRDLNNRIKSKLIDTEMGLRDGERRANKLWNR